MEELFIKYAGKIKKHRFSSFLKGYNLEEDVINEVFLIMIEKSQRELLDEDKINKNLKYWMLKATSRVVNKQKGALILKKPRNIKYYYDKVQNLVKKGYHEAEAKVMVELEESILSHRFVSPASQDVIDLHNYSLNQTEDKLIEKHQNKLFAEAQANCLEKYKEYKNERDYNILIDFHLKEIKKVVISEKYNLTKPRITQITQNGMDYLRKCIENLMRVYFNKDLS